MPFDTDLKGCVPAIASDSAVGPPSAILLVVPTALVKCHCQRWAWWSQLKLSEL